MNSKDYFTGRKLTSFFVVFFLTLFSYRKKGYSETRIFDGPETFDSVANHITCLVKLQPKLKIFYDK